MVDLNQRCPRFVKPFCLGVAIQVLRRAACFGHRPENQYSVFDNMQRSASDAPGCTPLSACIFESFRTMRTFRLGLRNATAHTNTAMCCQVLHHAFARSAKPSGGASRRVGHQRRARVLQSILSVVGERPLVSPSSAKASSATPNPSVKLSANGRPPSPSHRYGVHFLWLGLGVLPSSPAYLQR